jgi:asparaginyl-tRNA synthetase
VKFHHIDEIAKKENEGKTVAMRGWVYRQRVSKTMVFLVMRDSTGIIQATIKAENPNYEAASHAGIETSASLSGELKKDERAPGGYEIAVKDFEIIGRSELFPIAKDLSDEFLLDVRHLWLRSQKLTNVMKARAYVLEYLRDFFKKEGFWETHPPVITQAGCEGGSTLFEFNFFGEKVYLSQSAQLYLEVLMTSLEKVWCLNPSFRAERSRTIRHLAEYWHLEGEMAYFSNEDNMDFMERMLSHVCQRFAKEQPELLKFFGREPEELAKIKAPFERFSYKQALETLNKKGAKLKWGDDLGIEEERMLTKDKKAPIMIYNYPRYSKAFYMRVNPEDPETVLCADCLAPEGHGEIIGSSERIWEYDELMNALKAFKLDPKSYDWYIDIRKYGSVPHSGFGLGIERLLKWMLKLDHIRDAIPFPRTISRVKP